MRIITIARKPLSEKSVASNVQKHGCGGLNIGATRIGTEIRDSSQKDFSSVWGNRFGSGVYLPTVGTKKVEGRWPANLLLTHKSGCALDGTTRANCVEGCSVKGLDELGVHKSGVLANMHRGFGKHNTYGAAKHEIHHVYYGDEGSVARFFKQFKVDE